jgi:DNA-binding MarR family transcriptional regulator
MHSEIPDEILADLAEVVLRISRDMDPHAGEAAGVVPLTGTEAMILRWVDRNPGTSPSATAEATALQRSNLSAAMRSLVDKGMVDRRTDPANARLVQLFPTERARESIRMLRTHWARRLRSALPTENDGVDVALHVLTQIDARLPR